MSLREWYEDREVLITGSTSELGRNLLEKLLRCFPDVKIHLVIRLKDGLTLNERVKKIFASPGCERLLQERPDAIVRVESYEGNLASENLGTRSEDLRAMTNVSVVFHAGGPSERLLDYCRQLPNLRAVVVARDIFRCKEDRVPEKLLDEKLPNGMPLGLVRTPSLGPAYREPMPGFVELLKGPTAVMVGAGYMLGQPHQLVEIIPIDIAVNTLLTVARSIGEKGRTDEPVVCNAATLDCTWNELTSKGSRANRKFTYPAFGVRGVTSSVVLHWLVVLICEWLPSFICDGVLFLMGSKQRMMEERKRVRNVLKCYESVTMRTLKVERRKIDELTKNLTKSDQESFPVRADIDVEAYILCAAAATRKYCVDENNLKIVTYFMQTLLALFLLCCGYCYFYLK